MKKLVTGILAHVDAGKTTLSEAMLYLGGSIRKLGRVDNRDAFLDTEEMERVRGITIFSKQARFSWKNTEFVLLDTPGHVDFSAEMERTLQVLDYAVLVISGADGVQAHTRTLWKLLERYEIPVFLFLNKMDQQGTDRKARLSELQRELDGGCVDFADCGQPSFWENVAMCEEEALEQFLAQGSIRAEKISALIRQRKLFPCFFGSALRMQGVEELLDGLDAYTEERQYPTEFGARIYKITRDARQNRLTWLKITGGCLRVKDSHEGEKINEIRLYSGSGFVPAAQAEAGEICAVSGLSHTMPGQGLGAEATTRLPVLEPVLSYRVLLPDGEDAAAVLPRLRLLEEEEPQLHVVWEEALKEIQVRIMGEVQLEVLKHLVSRRFGLDISFAQGNVVYKETLAKPVVGVGHFEPLRHYGEVHLLLEPGEPESGLTYASACREEVLSGSWQRLVLGQLAERTHKGVLLGAPLTDVRITLLSGRTHNKHTEGGDMGQAALRALRQGLMEAGTRLLEPYYLFTLRLPENLVGRAMTDLERRSASLKLPRFEDGMGILTGSAPVTCLQGYHRELQAYSGGLGQLSCTVQGYFPCHNEAEVCEAGVYDAEGDMENPCGSVFCAHGAGYVVPWYEVKEHAHVPVEVLHETAEEDRTETENLKERCRQEERSRSEERDLALGTEEIDRILQQATHANHRADAPRKGIYRRRKPPAVSAETVSFRPIKRQEEYLLVDGYNVIFAWQELAELAKISLDGARGRLMDILCDYQAMRGCRLMLVFDAYRMEGHETEVLSYHNIQVVYTREAETADMFIEKFAHENSRSYRITVATSDGLEQLIIRGQGCGLLSARELQEEIAREKELLRERYLEENRG